MHKELKDSLDFIFEKEKLQESKISLYKTRKPPRKINRWIPTIASFSIVVIAVMICLPFIVDNNSLNVNQGSDQPKTQIEGSEIFNYKGAYLGDNSSVGQIISYSMGDQSYNGMQLYTSGEPYGVRIFMLTTMNPSTDVETIFTTASYLFTLIRNIDFVEFEYEDQVYSITKQDIELAFDINYYSLEDEKTLSSIISDILSNEPAMNLIQQLITTTQ